MVFFFYVTVFRLPSTCSSFWSPTYLKVSVIAYLLNLPHGQRRFGGRCVHSQCGHGSDIKVPCEFAHKEGT